MTVVLLFLSIWSNISVMTLGIMPNLATSDSVDTAVPIVYVFPPEWTTNYFQFDHRPARQHCTHRSSPIQASECSWRIFNLAVSLLWIHDRIYIIGVHFYLLCWELHGLWLYLDVIWCWCRYGIRRSFHVREEDELGWLLLLGFCLIFGLREWWIIPFKFYNQPSYQHKTLSSISKSAEF